MSLPNARDLIQSNSTSTRLRKATCNERDMITESNLPFLAITESNYRQRLAICGSPQSTITDSDLLLLAMPNSDYGEQAATVGNHGKRPAIFPDCEFHRWAVQYHHQKATTICTVLRYTYTDRRQPEHVYDASPAIHECSELPLC